MGNTSYTKIIGEGENNSLLVYCPLCDTDKHDIDRCIRLLNFELEDDLLQVSADTKYHNIKGKLSNIKILKGHVIIFKLIGTNNQYYNNKSFIYFSQSGIIREESLVRVTIYYSGELNTSNQREILLVYKIKEASL